MTWKLFSRCEICKKWKFYIAKRPVDFDGIHTISQKLMCNRCNKNILTMLITYGATDRN
jgi:hypothetical protein